MKNEKGITLIALVITIIVMLILVIVTISFAMNGGLFQKAKEGAEKTQVEILKEQAEVAKADAYAEYVQNGGTYNAGTVATAIAREVGGTATGDYVTVVTSAGTYYIVVGNDTNVTVTTVEPEGEQVYYVEKWGGSFYLYEGCIYVEDNGTWLRSNVVDFDVLNENGASNAETILGIDNISPDTPTYEALGSLQLVVINGDWYLFDKDPWTFDKFELMQFDTSVFSTAIQFN